ncbi:MAG: hypothetical protein Q8K36_06955, partial [Alphaproteobacteria bacterium]|nr:hypothetical protein [Alphaproteobacteria bacterium]
MLKKGLNALTALPIFKPLRKLKHTHYSTVFVMIHDGLMAFISLFVAIYLKVGDEFLDYSPGYLFKNLLVFMLISLSIFSWAKTYKTLWRFIAVEDLWPLSLAVVIANLVYLPAMHLLSIDEVLSKSILILNVFVMIILLSVPRFFARFFHDQAIVKLKETNAVYTIPVLLVGDDDPTELFIREVTYTP